MQAYTISPLLRSELQFDQYLPRYEYNVITTQERHIKMTSVHNLIPISLQNNSHQLATLF